MSDKKKVLIADDEEDIREILKLQLIALGYEVVTAYDGLDAISIAETELPDVILLDVMMPVISGLEVCKRLKEQAATMNIPVIMLSAASQESTIKEGLNAGAVDYIVKPIDLGKLEALIQSVVK